MKLLIFFYGILFFSQIAMAQQKIVELSDLQRYSLETQGVNGIIFEVEQKGLAERLNSLKYFGIVENVSFKVYWAIPKKFKIEVIGLPKGFAAKKCQLAREISPLLKILVPSKISAILKNYSLSKGDSSAEVVHIHGVDKSGTLPINSMALIFKKSGHLQSIKTYGRGAQDTRFEMSKRPWSHNKWVLNKMIDTTPLPRMIARKTTTIDYKMVVGHGVPEKVVVKTIFRLKNQAIKNQNSDPNGKEQEFSFKNYEINTGKAAKKIAVNKAQECAF